MVARLLVSTIAFFLASHFTKRWLEEQDIPKGMTRGAVIFTVAFVAAYGADWIVGLLV